jgi:hypothetical protein
MTNPVRENRILLPETVLFTTLPGPSRKRLESAYCYRLRYRAKEPHLPGCVLLWDVMGGRDIYQVALERLEGGGLRWHCTCADAIFRGSDRHVCKHVRGLMSHGREQAEAGNPELAPSVHPSDN